MKKIMFLAMATAALFAGCSDDNNFDSSQSEVPMLDGRQLIKIGLGNVSTITTKGTGTVGGVENETTNTHAWAGQRFNLFMFKKGDLALAINDLEDTNEGKPIYNDAVFEANGLATIGDITTLTAASEIDTTNNTHPYKYYPNDAKSYDFWAYRLDGADTINVATGKKAIVYDTLSTGTDRKITIGFKIDGSQDLLAAFAKPVQKDGSSFEDATRLNQCFSATSARHEIYPELNFKHLLSRLTFKVLAGNLETMQNVKVDSIKVIGKNKGTLRVASIAEFNADSLITWESTRDSLTLKERLSTAAANAELTQLTPNISLDTICKINEDSIANSWARTSNIGEALMVQATQPNDTVSTYDLVVFIHEDLNTNASATTPLTQKSEVKATISVPNSYFRRGQSYNVQIVLYGHKRIEVFTTLEQWNDGGTIAVDDDEFMWGN